MKKRMISNIAASAILAGTFVLSGCGSSKSSPPVVNDTPETYGVSGSASYVGDIFEGDVKVYDASGKELRTVALDANGDYSISGLNTKPSYVKLQSGAKGKGNDGIAGNNDDNRITLALSSDVSNSTANLSLSSYLNKEYNLNVPSPLSLAQKDYLLNIQETLVYLDIPYNNAFKYAGGALTTPVSTSAYSVLSAGTSTSSLLSQELRDLLGSAKVGLLQKVSEMLTTLTADYTGTSEEKKIAHNAIKVAMSSIKELASDGLNSVDLAALTAITAPANIITIKSWVVANINNNVNFYAQGVKMAKTATATPTAPPIAVDDAPTLIVTCANLPMTGTAAIVCGSQADNFKFSADFGELKPRDNDKNTPDGGLLLYMASSDLGDVTPEVAQSGYGQGRIEHTWIEKKYLRLNTAAKNLDTNAKFELIKDYLEPLFEIKGHIFENDNNPFNLAEGATRTFAATMVLHFTNDQAESTPNKEYLSATIQMDVTKTNGKYYFETPTDSKVLLTAKKLDDSTGVMIVTENDGLDDATIGDEFSFNPGKYFDRLIAAGDSVGVSNAAKEILVKNTTQKGPIKMHFTLHEKLSNGTFDKSFIRNPGTFEPASFALNLGGSTNPYVDAFDDGAVQAIKFKLILE